MRDANENRGGIAGACCHAALVVAIALCLPQPAMAMQASAAESTIQFDIPAGDLAAALDKFGKQSGIQLLYRQDIVVGKRSSAVGGALTANEALRRLLDASGVVFERADDSTFVLRPGSPPAAPSSGGPVGKSPLPAEKKDNVVGMPAVMVKGTRTLNMDIERTVDDPQPYVIFDRVEIERSGAVNLHDFLKQRLTMNTASSSGGQTGNIAGNVSNVNLRGLGSTQTLILIDGRRAARTSLGVSPGQTDLNGIPLAAIDRIEVLPTTASAIYGGAATGGVINIIMRRDFIGTEATLTYDNTFDTDSAIKRVDFASGFSLLDGNTSVLLSGSYSESNALLVKDRDLAQRGRELRMRNNPAFMLSGLPPVSPGVNIKSVNGSALVMKDGTPLNSSFTHAPEGYAGVASDGGAALLGNAGRYDLDTGSVPFSYAGLGNFSNNPRTKSVSGSVRHEFSENISAFLEASHSDNSSRYTDFTYLFHNLPASAPTNPFQQDITVVTSSDQLSGTVESSSVFDRFGAGLIYQLPGDWVASLDYTFSKAKVEGVINYPYMGAAFASDINSGVIDITRSLNAQVADWSGYIDGITGLITPVTSRNKNPALRLGGPIGSWKAGRPYMSLLVERQDMDYSDGAQIVNAGSLGVWFPSRYQKIDSAYLEFRLPLLSAAHGMRWVDELELQVAGRWDRYESKNADFQIWFPPAPLPDPQYVFNTVQDFNPLLALKYRPNGSLMLRASYGTGFVPPELGQLSMSTLRTSTFTNWIDPRRGNTGPAIPFDLIGGGNPNVQPERSINWSAGIVLTPASVEGLRVSLDYTHIEKEDNITTLSVQQILDNEAYFSDRVTRGAKLPTDPADWAGPVTRLDQSTINAARAELESYDLQLDYDLSTSAWGRFSFFALATWQTRLETQLAPTLPIIDILGVGTVSNVPLEFKGNAGVVWNRDAWSLGWTARHASSYYAANPDIPSSLATLLAQGNGGRIPSQTYHDAFFSYRFGAGGSGSPGQRRLTDGMELRVGVRNIFNTKPPYDVSNARLQYSFLGDPRLASYYISLRQTF